MKTIDSVVIALLQGFAAFLLGFGLGCALSAPVVIYEAWPVVDDGEHWLSAEARDEARLRYLEAAVRAQGAP